MLSEHCPVSVCQRWSLRTSTGTSGAGWISEPAMLGMLSVGLLRLRGDSPCKACMHPGLSTGHEACLGLDALLLLAVSCQVWEAKGLAWVLKQFRMRHCSARPGCAHIFPTLSHLTPACQLPSSCFDCRGAAGALLDLQLRGRQQRSWCGLHAPVRLQETWVIGREQLT